MDDRKDYGWGYSLKKIVEAGFEELRERLRQAESKVAAAIRRDGPFRGKKSRPATILEKLAIQAVSCLYLAEKGIRALAGKSFVSKFLAEFQTLTRDSEKLIQDKLGQIPIPLPLPMSQADGTGGLTVAMLLTSADRASVKALLPEGVELMRREELKDLQSQVPAGRHPVMIGLGFNSDVRPVRKTPTFVKMNYLELTIGVPGVRLSSEFGNPSGPYFYIPALFLNAFTPTLLGWAFGFRKRLKRIKASAYSYRVAHLISGEPLLTAEVIADQNSDIRFATDIRELAPWLRLLDQPIVTRTWWGNLKFTFFDWDWLFTPTTPALVKLSFASDEVPLAPQGPSVFTSLAESADSEKPEAPPVAGRAYLMSVPWRLLLPFGRETLERKSGLWRRMWGRR